VVGKLALGGRWGSTVGIRAIITIEMNEKGIRSSMAKDILWNAKCAIDEPVQSRDFPPA
jgi:hypothetical protein